MRTIERGGPRFRVADPDWDDPLSGDFAAERGGRWNPPGSFPVVYLCSSVGVARANVYRRLVGQPYGPEDLDPGSAPRLVRTTVPVARYADLVTARGLRAAGLPDSYPRDSRARRVGHGRCRPVGVQAHAAGLAGLAARSAALGSPRTGEELAHFPGRRRLRADRIEDFKDWFW